MINVEELDIDQFNNSPNLKEEKKEYKYDVIYEGAADLNNEKDLSENAEKAIENFIETGRGYLCGHDTFGNYSKNRKKLARGMGIAVYSQNDKGEYEWSVDGIDKKEYLGCVGDSEIELSKTGLLTNYPWFIENKELKVPMSHSNKQFAFGHVWMQYKNSTFRPTKESPITEIEIIKIV